MTQADAGFFKSFNEGWESSPQLNKETLQKAFEIFDHLVDEQEKHPIHRFVLPAPAWITHLKPKPMFYKLWSKRRRLRWLRYYRSPIATLEYMGYGHLVKKEIVRDSI